MKKYLDTIVYKNGQTVLGEIARVENDMLHFETKYPYSNRITPLSLILSYTIGEKTCMVKETKLVNGRQQDEFIHELNKLTGKS